MSGTENSQTRLNRIQLLGLLVLGGISAVSLPWAFILLIPATANFFLLQPMQLMFVTYPAIFIVAGYVARKLKVRLILAAAVMISAYIVVISLAIAFAASTYAVFYLVFLIIGHWAAGLASKNRPS